MNQARITISQFLGAATSGVGAVASWQTQIDWLFRVGASATAILVGVMTIRSLLRKERKKGLD
jgi:hypothetical protein